MSFFFIVCLTYVLSTSFMWHKEIRSSFVDDNSHVQHRCSYSGFTWLFTYKEMPDFYLMMDIVKPVEIFAMQPQMITQERVPDASHLHDWWLPDGCLGEGRKRYHFNMFLSNITSWSSGESRHMVYKRQCSWRGQTKYRTSGTPQFDSHHCHFLCSVPEHKGWFPAYPKAENQGEEGSQVVPILTGAESLQHTNPQKTLYRNHSGNRCWGRCSPQGLPCLLGGQGVFNWWDKGAASLSVLPSMTGMAQLQVQAGLKGLSHCSSGFLIASLVNRKCHSYHFHRTGK